MSVARRLTALLRQHPVFAGLVCVHLVLKTVLAINAHSVALRGDEVAYADGARALRNGFVDLVALRAPDATQLTLNVVGNGWFMPGPSLVLTPLFLVVPDAGPTAIRLYLGVLTTLGLVGAAMYTQRVLGKTYALAVLVLPGLLPMWVLFSFAATGDLLAGLVALVLVVRLVRMAQQLREGTGWGPGSAAALGVLLLICLYLRSSALPLVVGVLVLTFLAALFLATPHRRRRTAAAAGLAAATLVAGLLPWSLAASAAMESRVLTTTTVPLSLAVAFGDVDELCYGPCDRGSVWFGSVRYSREVARVSGASEVDVQAEMSDRALRGVTIRSYADDVVDNATRFLAAPTAFLPRLLPEAGSVAGAMLATVSILLYSGGLLALATVALLPFRRRGETQVLALLVTLLTAACLVQPLLHVSSGRYWPIFAPLMGLAVGVLWTARGTAPVAAGERGVSVLKIVSTAALVIVVGGVAVAANW